MKKIKSDKPKLLIVEDNQLTSSLLFTIFDSMGCHVKEIANGNEVLPYVDKNKVDVMILDLELPGLTGDQIYAAMKWNKRLSQIPIIPFTAMGSELNPSRYVLNLENVDQRLTAESPSVIFKIDSSGESKKITNDIIDEVSRCLLKQKIPLTKEIEEYYEQTRNIKKAQIAKNLL